MSGTKSESITVILISVIEQPYSGNSGEVELDIFLSIIFNDYMYYHGLVQKENMTDSFVHSLKANIRVSLS